MSQNIRLKRSAVPNRVPSTDQLELGELALNTYDGKLYLKQNINGSEAVIDVGFSASYALSSSFATTASYALISTTPIIVTSPAGGLYYINGVAQPVLTFVPGQNYRFDTSAVSSSHPFKFSLSPNGPTQYTYGVTSGSGYIEINVDYNTSSSLYYYCTIHNNMGNAANTLRDENLIHNSQTSSLSVSSASFAATASSADNFLVRGTLTAQTIVAQTITSSVEFITGSTKFGSLLSNTHQFTGSIFATGSFTVGGTLIATALSGSGANLTDIGTIEKVFYVAEDGSDTNDGKSLSSPFRTIKKASIAASASRAANPGFPVYRQSIQVKSGYYSEIAPITLVNNVSLLGDDLRSVVVSPTSATSGSNLFLMNSGTYCQGLRLEGCVIDSLENPRNGFFFAFAPSASISTSPYVQNCSAIFAPPDKFYTPLNSASANPLVGNGPGGMLIDDSVLDGYSPLKSMVVDAYTQVAFNGIGVCIRGRGYSQLVSFFTNFSRIGVYCIDGGHASLLNSNTTFGDFGLRAKGLRMLIKPDISAVSASIDVSGSLLISANKANIQAYMTQQLLISGSYKENYYSGSTYCYKDSGIIVDSLADDLLSPGAARISQFTSGMFKGQDVSSGSIFTLPIASGSTFTKGAVSVVPRASNASGSLIGDFILGWQFIRKYIVDDPSGNFSTLSTPARNKVNQLMTVLIDTVTAVDVNGAGAQYLQEFGSLITSTSHDFSYAGAGVNFLALPINQGGVGETNVALRIFEETGGRIFHTSGDETGDFYAGNDFIIRQATGTIEGRTFTKAITAQITPINLALETQS